MSQRGLENLLDSINLVRLGRRIRIEASYFLFADQRWLQAATDRGTRQKAIVRSQVDIVLTHVQGGDTLR